MRRVGALALVASAAFAAANASPFCGLQPPADYKILGSLVNRSSSQITTSRWSVGAETMDRNYTFFNSWRSYLAPLGVKAARVQAGWARCDPSGNGQYDWAWLDEIVQGMVADGVSPWLQTSFGNPAYPGGGTSSVGSPLPEGTAALAGWTAWVQAMVDRYFPLGVTIWEVWNEPNIQSINATAYASFVALTAGVIKAAQPTATVRYGVVAGVDIGYAVDVSTALAEAGQGSLVDQLTFHPYVYNPDSSYSGAGGALDLARDVTKVLPHVQIVQGENGAPSVGGGYGALTGYNWTECSQAKYFLRRLVHDGGLGIPSSAFSIVDLCYANPHNPAEIDVNHKGLLLGNCTDSSKPVVRPKQAYTAVQHVTSVFEDSVVLPLTEVYPAAELSYTWALADGEWEGSGAASQPGWNLTVLAWAAADGGGRLLFAAWNSSGTPLDAGQAATTLVDLQVTITGMSSAPPAGATYVGVDMVSGRVFAVPQPQGTAGSSASAVVRLRAAALAGSADASGGEKGAAATTEGTGPSTTGAGVAGYPATAAAVTLSFTGVPVLDFPMLLADQTLVQVA